MAFGMAFDVDTDVRCTRCGEHKPDQVGLSLPATDDAGVRDLGFCCVECLLAWIDATYPTRAAAAPSSVAGPPPAAGEGTGSAREPVGSGKSSVAPGRSNHTLDLEAIKARDAAATAGPWKTAGPGYSISVDDGSGFLVANTFLKGAAGTADLLDAEFIAHARTDVPALVSEVERQRAEIERLISQLTDAHQAAMFRVDL